jgi:transcriptional regulator GlxA family with amidase domain
MESHLEYPLTVRQITALLGLSSRRLEGLFRDTLGQPPGDYYRAQRLNAARRQLVAGAASAIQIATSCGFNSAAVFSCAYRRHFGEGPTDTRRRARLG